MPRRCSRFAVGGIALLMALAAILPARADTLADGVAALERDDAETARRLLLQASSEAPLDPRPYEWLAKIYERSMDMDRLQHALDQATRLHKLARHKAETAKAAADAAANRMQHRTAIRLSAADMPKREIADIESKLAPLRPAPLPPLPAGATRAQKRAQLQQMQGTLSRLHGALSAIRQRLVNYASAPLVIKDKLDALQSDADKYSNAVKQLKQELGEE